MSKISLAVKYRPQKFSELTEQKYIVDILENQIKTNEFQRAYLFTGPAGCGKTSLARIFANEINKGNGQPIEIDAASNNGIDNVRNIIQDSKRKPLDCDYKVFIMDEVHSLTSESWQALLKLLEEPPTSSVFIMCTTNPEKIPKTILSRVQRFDFQKISKEGIVNRLNYILKQENIHCNGLKTLYIIAETANGGMRDAITLLDKCISYGELNVENVLSVLGTADTAIYEKLENLLLTKDKSCIEIIKEIFYSGKDLKLFINEFAKYIVNENMKMLKGEKNIKDISQITKLVFDIRPAIKYENDIYTIVCLMLLNYCNEV